MRSTILIVLLLCALAASVEGDTNAPLPLDEVVQHITMPPGFRATLFAGEPDICQPVAMTFDDRGRLWVVECYTYTGTGATVFDPTKRDRIVIFEDSTGSGHFDKRKVFWDQGVRLTGIALGFGGVYCTAAPNLIFIPDKNGDDVPDGPPEVLLDGWSTDVGRHNVVNGLKWGPDGWLYGREGISCQSVVGAPGTLETNRVHLDGGIWRYHPARKIFEAVSHGTTNPWGSDWDEYGEMFFCNTVIGHLWHAIPGVYFKRMFGESAAPYRYGLIDQMADHYHWDTGKSWTQSRNGVADSLGGGHAHCGLMIYEGDNWPDEYRGQFFMLNFHGRRINVDIPRREGSGYSASHRQDFALFGDPWFQGIDLDYGPDGAVTVLDWSDTGECHGYTGVHQNTGRIFKIAYDGPKKPESAPGPAPSSLLTNNLANYSDEALLQLQFHPNEWFARHARRLLQERIQSLIPSFREKVLAAYAGQTNIAFKMRLLFVLHAIGMDSFEWLTARMSDENEHIRAWAIRWLGEGPNPDWDRLSETFAEVASRDNSPFVRLYLASELQRMPEELREPLAQALLQHGEDASDHNLPLMIWYGIEPMVARLPDNAIRLAMGSQIPIVREYIARRLGEDINVNNKSVNDLLAKAGQMDEKNQRDVLRGLRESLQGRKDISIPPAWLDLRNQLAKTSNKELAGLVREVGAEMKDSWAWEELARIALDANSSVDDRHSALSELILAQPPGLAKTLEQVLEDRDLAGIAAHGLLVLGDPNVATWTLKRWGTIDAADHALLLGIMVSRAPSASLLLDAVAHNVVPHSALTAFHARQIHDLNDPALNKQLAAVWGEVRSSDADKLALMARYRALLTPDRLQKASASHGREVFSRTCAVCHRLFGEGASIGPDLTGSGRANVEYLIENIIDPSAIVAADYRVSEVELKDGRSLSALIVAKSDHGLTLQTPTERFNVERNDIVSLRETKLSLMPEGLLLGLKDDGVCNLVAYLTSPAQVRLPDAAKK